MTAREFFHSVLESVQLICGDPLVIRAFAIAMIFGAMTLIGLLIGILPIQPH